MSWEDIARKDFQDAVRSLLLVGLTGLLILLVAGLALIPWLLADDAPGYEQALGFVFSPISFLVPIIGLIVGYRAIVGERESGAIRFLLGLPNTRLDVIVGKTVGRAAVVAVPIVLGFLAGAIVVFALYEGFSIVDYLGLFVFSVLLGLIYVALAVGVSASVSSRAKAVGGAVGVYVLLDVIWSNIPAVIYFALERSLPDFTALPAWYVFLERLGPSQSLNAVVADTVGFVGAGEVDMTTGGRIAGEVPFYLGTWVSALLVLFWILAPLALGYHRFSRATLG